MKGIRRKDKKPLKTFFYLLIMMLITTLLLPLLFGPCIDLDLDGVCLPEDCDDGNPYLFYMQDFYLDEDHDGYGTGPVFYTICWGVGGYFDYPRDEAATNDQDCKDLDRLINPGMQEIIGNDIDENCDGILGGKIDLQRHNA